MRPHIRIEKPASEPGQFQIVTYDKIIAVGPDGTEVEISQCCTEWRELNQVGSMRKIEIVLGGYYVTQQDGLTVLLPEDTLSARDLQEPTAPLPSWKKP